MADTSESIANYISTLPEQSPIEGAPIKSSTRVSVIIPAFNESYCIGDLLDSLDSQDHENFEVIVVDNGSSDHTRMLVESYQRKVKFPLYILDEKKPGPGHARKLGMDFALRRLQLLGQKDRKHYLAIADADVVVPHNWIDTIITKFEQNDRIGALAGTHGATDEINLEIKKILGIPDYFNLISKIILYLQKHSIGRIKLSSSNAAFSVEAYAVAGGMVQPYNLDGTMGLHEAGLLAERIAEQGYIIAAMESMARSRQRRHLYDLLHKVSSYHVYEQDRFLPIREDENVLLQVALSLIPKERWLEFREHMISAVLDNMLFRPFQQGLLQIDDLRKILNDQDFIQDLGTIQTSGSKFLSYKYASRITAKILADLGHS